MANELVRIATRKSPLALWQAEYVAESLKRHHPGLQVEFLKLTTQGDKILDSPLAKIGGKGLFVKELEKALLDNVADIAVHSMKDVPVDFPDSLHIATICEREDPRDAFVSSRYDGIEQLPQGAVVGTSSLRRQCQIRAHRPDLVIKDLRGNVGSRLKKLDDGVYDAIILAAAGLIRLALKDRIRGYISSDWMLPAVGQGAVGIECRRNDSRIESLLRPLNHPDTAHRVSAERAFNQTLEGGCQVPIAGHATLANGKLHLRGLVGMPDGTAIIRGERQGPIADAEKLGRDLAGELLARGAKDILDQVFAGGR